MTTHTTKHPTLRELEAALEHIKASPADEGRLEMISTRPSVEERELVEVGELDTECGLIGEQLARPREQQHCGRVGQPGSTTDDNQHSRNRNGGRR